MPLLLGCALLAAQARTGFSLEGLELLYFVGVGKGALTGNPALPKGLEESFASSIIALPKIESEQDRRLIVDAAPLLFARCHQN